MCRADLFFYELVMISLFFITDIIQICVSLQKKKMIMFYNIVANKFTCFNFFKFNYVLQCNYAPCAKCDLCVHRSA